MVRLSKADLKNGNAWQSMGIKLPGFDIDKMELNTRQKPTWVHFGAGNIFRGFTAALQQTLLDENLSDVGITAVETFDTEIIEKIYDPYDNLSLLVIMNKDGSLDTRVIASIGEALVGDFSRADDWNRLEEIFKSESLQMVSFTITEKGYNLKRANGEYLPDVVDDLKNGPVKPKHLMSKVAALAYVRFRSGKLPVAFVSMDNCSRNGERLQNSVEEVVKEWVKAGLVEKEFLDYIQSDKVSFPLSMIDKITPRPSDRVRDSLTGLGIEGLDIIVTSKNTYIAPFVNAEGPQYLVIEDKFPNGRPPLEKAGVIFTSRDTVDKVERMKVGTCLNPLHTTLAVFGCLLGHQSIYDAVTDPDLKCLVENVGYVEGLPVVVNPEVIDPNKFIKEVIEERLANPYIPDAPQRIATDTSQKLGPRFIETIKEYCKLSPEKAASLKFIPLVIAGWCRYLLGIDDHGNEFKLSPDPLMDSLKAVVSDIKFGEGEGSGKKIRPILSNRQIFDIDLYAVGLGEKIEGYFEELNSGAGAVRDTLKKYCN